MCVCMYVTVTWCSLLQVQCRTTAYFWRSLSIPTGSGAGQRLLVTTCAETFRAMYKGTRLAIQSCSHEQTVLFIFSMNGTAAHITCSSVCKGLVVPAARGVSRYAFVHSCSWWVDIQPFNIIFTGEIYRHWNFLPCDQSRVGSRNVMFVRRASDYGQCADVRLSMYTCAGSVCVTALLWRFWSSGMLRLVSSSEASKECSVIMFRVK